MKVWVVMEQLAIFDGDDGDIDLAAVHASREGAEGNLTVTEENAGGCKGPFRSGSRERYIMEMEVLP